MTILYVYIYMSLHIIIAIKIKYAKSEETVGDAYSRVIRMKLQ